MNKALVPTHNRNIDLDWQEIEGTAAPTSALLSSPASNTPCVHWRLRITEALSSNVLVHDVASEEAFELHWLTDPSLPPQRMPIDGHSACIDALASVYGCDSPAAKAVAQTFGLSGIVSVEEILIRPGTRLQVNGRKVGSSASSPYRAAQPEFPLEHVRVRVPGPLRRTALLPWALGTGAALAGVLGAAGAILRRMDAGPSAKAFINWVMPAEIGEPRPGYVRWP